MSRKTKKTDHIGAGNNSLRCLNCGDEQGLALPLSINVYEGAVKGFTKDHRACESSERGRKRFEFSTPDEWITSWDTGISSKTIWMIGTGRVPEGTVGSPPLDPQDFGRCFRLLEKFPAWRAHLLPKVAERYPAWAPLVARWDDLEALYREEFPTGKAPRLSALMQELRKGTT